VRSADLPPGHHGGPLHPLAGLHAITKLVGRLEGEDGRAGRAAHRHRRPRRAARCGAHRAAGRLEEAHQPGGDQAGPSSACTLCESCLNAKRQQLELLALSKELVDARPSATPAFDRGAIDGDRQDFHA
jgi:hypothetical protein